MMTQTFNKLFATFLLLSLFSPPGYSVMNPQDAPVEFDRKIFATSEPEDLGQKILVMSTPDDEGQKIIAMIASHDEEQKVFITSAPEDIKQKIFITSLPELKTPEIIAFDGLFRGFNILGFKGVEDTSLLKIFTKKSGSAVSVHENDDTDEKTNENTVVDTQDEQANSSHGDNSTIFEEVHLDSKLDKNGDFIVELSLKFKLSDSKLDRYYSPIFHPEKQDAEIGYIRSIEDTITFKFNKDALHGLAVDNSILLDFSQGRISISQDGKNQQIGLFIKMDDFQQVFNDLLLNESESSTDNRIILEKVNYGDMGFYELHRDFSTNGIKKETGKLSIYFDKENHATVSGGAMEVVIDLKGGKIKNRIKSLFK